MKTSLIIRRLFRRPTCVVDPSARLLRSARIVNAGDCSELIRIGANSIVRGELLVFAHGGSIQIGDWCYIGEGTRIWSGSHVHVGDRVMIAHNVNIFDSLTHPLDPEQRHLHFRTILTTGHPRDIQLDDRPIVIGDDVWIGAGAIVLRGVTIGRGAVLGAGAVLTHDLPPMCVAAGNPARVIRDLDPASRSLDMQSSATGVE